MKLVKELIFRDKFFFSKGAYNKRRTDKFFFSKGAYN
jgi:hypothetical protein